jgi:hypothetical protein
MNTTSPTSAPSPADIKVGGPAEIATDTEALSGSTDVSAARDSEQKLIAILASLKPMEYDRLRKEQAKALGIQVKTLDDLVKAARNDDGESVRFPFPEVEPHPEPIDPALLLNEAANLVRRYVVMDKEQTDAAALWIAMTWFIDVVEVAPLGIITAPEKACGKSQLLDVLGRMVSRPLPAASSSASFLFRAIAAWRPTILIDEADTFIRENEDLRGQNSVWCIPASNSKSKRIRSVPLNESAKDVLSQIGTEGAFEHVFVNRKTKQPYTTIMKTWGRLREKAGLKLLRLHDLRHFHATSLILSGVPIYEIKTLLGHADLSTTERYLHINNKKLAEASKNIDVIMNGAMRVANQAAGAAGSGTAANTATDGA